MTRKERKIKIDKLIKQLEDEIDDINNDIKICSDIKNQYQCKKIKVKKQEVLANLLLGR